MRRWAIAGALAVLATGACGGGGERPAPCDDRVRSAESAPPALRARLTEAGIDDVVGSGVVWFIAPQAERWSSVVDDRGQESVAKLPLWLDVDGPLPRIEVTRIDGAGDGQATAAPTADGLPGPLPALATFPHGGCWEVAAVAEGGEARIRINVT